MKLVPRIKLLFRSLAGTEIVDCLLEVIELEMETIIYRARERFSPNLSPLIHLTFVLRNFFPSDFSRDQSG